MLVAKQNDVRSNMKSYFDSAYNGEAVFVPRVGNRNVYIISEKEYAELQNAKKNSDYLKGVFDSVTSRSFRETLLESVEELRLA